MRCSSGVSNKWEGYGSRNSQSNPLKSSLRTGLSMEQLSGCSVVRLSRLLWEQEVGGSNPPIPTKRVLVEADSTNLDVTFMPS